MVSKLERENPDEHNRRRRERMKAQREFDPILERPITKIGKHWSCGGHTFNDQMICNRCDISFDAHQDKPKLCKGGTTKRGNYAKRQKGSHGSRKPSNRSRSNARQQTNGTVHRTTEVG